MKDPCEACPKRKQCKVPGECTKYQKYWTDQERMDNPFFYRKNPAIKTRLLIHPNKDENPE